MRPSSPTSLFRILIAQNQSGHGAASSSLPTEMFPSKKETDEACLPYASDPQQRSPAVCAASSGLLRWPHLSRPFLFHSVAGM